jgi:hypothetical protein
MVDDNENYLDNNPKEVYAKKFKRLCLIYHLDKNNGKDKKFKELNNARDAINEYYNFTWRRGPAQTCFFRTCHGGARYLAIAQNL